MSTAKFDTLQNAAGTVSVPVNTVVNGSAKAWVNFNGIGTVAIRAGFNVSSITDNGTGNYTVNFTNALADVNFSAVANSKSADNTTLGRFYPVLPCGYATTSVRLLTSSPSSGSITDAVAADAALITLSVFG